MKDKKKLKEKHISMIIHQLLKGLELLNKHGIVINNLKPSNILLYSDQHWDIKISDVGLQVLYEQKRDLNLSGNETQWMAPELANNRSNPKTDVWTVGAITYWLLTGKEPLNGPPIKENMDDGESGSKELSKDCVDFVQQAMTKDLS